jgi:hypothetical protein
MSFVPQTNHEWVEDSDDGSAGIAVEILRREHVFTMPEMQDVGPFRQAVLREMTAAFLTTSTEEGELRGCVASLIDENGAEWVWRNRETVFDIIEFHGFVRKDGAYQ